MTKSYIMTSRRDSNVAAWRRRRRSAITVCQFKRTVISEFGS